MQVETQVIDIMAVDPNSVDPEPMPLSDEAPVRFADLQDDCGGTTKELPGKRPAAEASIISLHGIV